MLYNIWEIKIKKGISNTMILKIIIYLKTNSSTLFKPETIKQKLKDLAVFFIQFF